MGGREADREGGENVARLEGGELEEMCVGVGLPLPRQGLSNSTSAQPPSTRSTKSDRKENIGRTRR